MKRNNKKNRINSCNLKATHELGLGLCFEPSGINILLSWPTILVFNNNKKLPNASPNYVIRSLKDKNENLHVKD